MSRILRKDVPSASKAEGILTFHNAYLTYQEECALFERTWDDNTQERYGNDMISKIIPHLRHDYTPIHISVCLTGETAIHEEVGLHGAPFPHHFARTTDVLNAYHTAFQQDDDQSEP